MLSMAMRVTIMRMIYQIMVSIIILLAIMPILIVFPMLTTNICSLMKSILLPKSGLMATQLIKMTAAHIIPQHLTINNQGHRTSKLVPLTQLVRLMSRMVPLI